MGDNWLATYRLQVHAGFPLAEAAAVVPYLAGLGVSHVYLSPCLQATPGSMHGYDVTDPTRISDDLGGEAGWRQFCHEAHAHGLGVLLDLVPNHMAASQHNPWWDDLLAHGPASRYHRFFDVVSDPLDGRWRIHLATLGQPYGEALAKGELQVAADSGRPRIVAPGQSWPLTPVSWRQLLGPDEADDPVFDELAAALVQREFTDAVADAYRQAAAQIDLLWASRSDASRERVAAVNRDPEALHVLLDAQWYALHHWRREGEVTNYRRFFDIGTLAALRMEDPVVFAAVHQRVAVMFGARELAGVRIDHPDGLRSPRTYFERLRKLFPAGRIYVEKILENDEQLRPDWPVDGTVGYDFLSKVNRLWMDEQKSDALSAIYADFTGHTVNLSKVVRDKKSQIVRTLFEADLERLTRLAATLAQADWRTRDLSVTQLRAALELLVVLLPVYRTYRDGPAVEATDRTTLTNLLALARARGETIEPAIFNFLERVFLDERAYPEAAEFIARWQQLTPAVTAKGVEDTTFYCYDRMVSCNEVGGQASLLGISSDKFHEFCHRLGHGWPATLLATSTHDHKRSEDVRTRISVLTEDPDAWSEALQAWSTMNLPAWQGRAPDRHLEYLLYQTLVGAWPIERERAWEYLRKASREAKINTSWREPNAAYEDSIRGFLEGIYASPKFLASLEAFVAPLVLPGRINSLAQTLIKLTAPGVPDFYQGSELWDLSLVDPDNRRPVDFARRRDLLANIETTALADSLQDWDSGRAKLGLIHRVLALRRERPELFGRDSAYQPVTARGSHLANLFAYLRGNSLLVVVPRFTRSLRDDWGDTQLPLPPGTWRDWLGGDSFTDGISPRALFQRFPVAALVLQP